MGLKRSLMRVRALDYLMSITVVVFMTTLVLMNMFLSAGVSPKHDLSSRAMAKVEEVQDVPQGRLRARRDVDDSWSIPADQYPVSLGVPWDCSQASILSEFPNATCFGYCTSSSCSSDAIASIQSGDSELVCTAKIMQLGFRRSGTHDISRWIKQHRDVTAKYADMFIDSQGEVIFGVCPVEQLRDTTSAAYFNPYSVSSIGSSQKSYYVHCENCLTTAYVDYYFGTLFVDLPTAMMSFIHTTNQKFIITLKNPTDRAIAEYFYPYIQDGTDLTTVGGQTLHDAMSAAIDQVVACMAQHGPTACVYGYGNSGDMLAETEMLYESCYATHLSYVTQQISSDQIYFMKIEEYQADPAGKIQDLYNFVGLDYLGPIELPQGGHIHKPILTETVVMMDAFFAPFNSELGTLLGDSKWLYTRA